MESPRSPKVLPSEDKKRKYHKIHGYKLYNVAALRSVSFAYVAMNVHRTKEEIQLSAILRVQRSFRARRKQREIDAVKLKAMKEDEVVMELQAIWQILVTGFEIIKFPKIGRARKRIIWLSLDGKLCVGRAKAARYAGKFIYLRYHFLSKRFSSSFNKKEHHWDTKIKSSITIHDEYLDARCQRPFVHDYSNH